MNRIAVVLVLALGCGCQPGTGSPEVEDRAQRPTPAPGMPGAKPNTMTVFTPVPGSVVRSPLTVRGEAPGSWFFEASFPVRLRDAGGREIAVTTARAQSDWMTEKLVPFEAVLEFGGATGTSGTLVLEKDNPSGLPENADAILIKVRFVRAAGDSS